MDPSITENKASPTHQTTMLIKCQLSTPLYQGLQPFSATGYII